VPVLSVISGRMGTPSFAPEGSSADRFPDAILLVHDKPPVRDTNPSGAILLARQPTPSSRVDWTNFTSSQFAHFLPRALECARRDGALRASNDVTRATARIGMIEFAAEARTSTTAAPGPSPGTCRAKAAVPLGRVCLSSTPRAEIEEASP